MDVDNFFCCMLLLAVTDLMIQVMVNDSSMALLDLVV